MHPLVLETLQQTPAPHILTRLPLDDGALIACFPAGPAPRWLAKTAHGLRACQRLASEAGALARLEPYAHILGVPRLLAWQQSAPPCPPQACLIQSGVPGSPAPWRWNLSRPWGQIPPELLAASEWLGTFQRLVRPPRVQTIAELVLQTRSQLAADGSSCPGDAPLLATASRLLAFVPDAATQCPTVVVHGDFWAGNLLFHSLRPADRAKAASLSHGNRPGLSVIDWSGFAQGSALEDLLTAMGALGPGPSQLQRWLAVFFSPSRPRDFLRDRATTLGYSDQLARLAFHLFLARRLSWELGFRLQTRNVDEQQQARSNWTELFAWMAQHRYPDPFTPHPV